MLEWKVSRYGYTHWTNFGFVQCTIEWASGSQAHVITLGERKLKRTFASLGDAQRYAIKVAAVWLERAAKAARAALDELPLEELEKP